MFQLPKTYDTVFIVSTKKQAKRIKSRGGINVSIDAELRQQCEDAAKADCRTLSSFVAFVLRRYFSGGAK